MLRKARTTYLIGACICLAMLIVASIVGKEVVTEDYRDSSFQVKLYRHTTGKVISLPLDTYLTQVVAAEMPASFSDEALKAQVVAARTYVVRKYKAGGNPNCPGTAKGALLCDDPAHAQAMAASVSQGNFKRLQELVHATDGEILVDGTGQPIDALFHSNCGGYGTASAAEIWGREVPYLQSSPCQGFHPNKDTMQKLTSKALLAKLDAELGVAAPALKLQTNNANLVKAITLGNTNYQRQILRDTFNLPSSTIFATKQGNLITLKSKGAGHGVGMCQYGAESLGDRGVSYRQILSHYYAETKLTRFRTK